MLALDLTTSLRGDLPNHLRAGGGSEGGGVSDPPPPPEMPSCKQKSACGWKSDGLRWDRRGKAIGKCCGGSATPFTLEGHGGTRTKSLRWHACLWRTKCNERPPIKPVPQSLKERHTHARTHTHAHTHAHTDPPTHPRTDTRMHARTHACTHPRTRTRTHTDARTHPHTHPHTHTHTHTHNCKTNGHNAVSECQNPRQLELPTGQSMFAASRRLSAVTAKAGMGSHRGGCIAFKMKFWAASGSTHTHTHTRMHTRTHTHTLREVRSSAQR